MSKNDLFDEASSSAEVYSGRHTLHDNDFYCT